MNISVMLDKFVPLKGKDEVTISLTCNRGAIPAIVGMMDRPLVLSIDTGAVPDKAYIISNAVEALERANAAIAEAIATINDGPADNTGPETTEGSDAY